MECHIAHSVERQTLELEVRDSKPTLGSWWGWIPPNQPYPNGTATTLLAQL